MEYDYGHCHACGGRVEERLVEHGVQAGDGWLVIRSVPTGVCIRCGEKILRWDVAERLEAIVNRRSEREPADHIDVPIFSY